MKVREGRAAFTLIELIVVMTIIAILAGLLLAATAMVRWKAKDVQARNDIQQLATAVEAFKSRYEVGYLPSRIILRNDLNSYGASQIDQDSLSFLVRMWPRIQSSPTPIPGKRFSNQPLFGNGSRGWMPDDTGAGPQSAYLLEGDQCLVFFLGGIQAQDQTIGLYACRGFGTNKNNPTLITGVPVETVLFEFKPTQLGIIPRSNSQNVGYSFFDAYSIAPSPGQQWDQVNGGNPYAYFSSYAGSYNPYGGTDCPTLQVSPYIASTAPTLKYMNDNGFQIICAGRNRLFGPGAAIWNPLQGYGDDSPNHPAPGADDLSNFSKAKLSEPVQ